MYSRSQKNISKIVHPFTVLFIFIVSVYPFTRSAAQRLCTLIGKATQKIRLPYGHVEVQVTSVKLFFMPRDTDSSFDNLALTWIDVSQKLVLS